MTTLVGVRRGVTGSSFPVAAFSLPLGDLGAGAVNLNPGNSAPGTSATFTRATTAWTKLSTGLWASVASGTARSSYLGATTAIGAYGGYFCEAAATNQCLQARDLSNASWTKVNTTAAKDQTGIDGAANSASSLTATAGGGTCLQTITEAATASALSMFLIRITGVGTITIQQGATTLDVTASLNSVTWTRVELDASVLNPAIGIVIGTNGDKIGVDMVQFENTAGTATSPIPTTTVSVTRNADILTYPTAGNLSGTLGTAYAEIASIAVGAVWVGTFTGAVGGIPLRENSNFVGIYDGTGTVSGQPITLSATSVQKVASRWSGTLGKTYVAGVGTATAALDGDLSLQPNICMGAQTTGPLNINGTIKNVKLWLTALTDAQIGAL